MRQSLLLELLAVVAAFGWPANRQEDAVYLYTEVDSTGQRLDAASNYTLTFQKGLTPPTDGFWSITMYEIDKGRWFVFIALNKFTVSPRDNPKPNADGSLTLYFQSESPGKDKEANALARDGLAAGRVTRRANALVLLDKGMSCQQVAEVFLFDDDTIRGWYDLFEQSGVEGLSHFDVGGSSSKMTPLQCGALKAWVGATLPRSTRHIGAWIAKEFGLVYESRSGLIALLHRLGLEYHKPEVISRKLDPKTQKAFIASYEDLLNSKGDDEVAIFVDAVHPTHAARPVGCWAPKEQKLAIEQTSGRERINIHGAIDLETGQTRMIEAETIDAISTIRLLESLESLYPLMVCIHVFLDNARYHHAKLVKEWLARPSCRIKLHFLPTYCPHLNPIERIWGVMHKNITHNKCYGTCGELAETTLEFLRDEVPRRWAEFCDSVTDNFRIISPKDFRLLG